jgi:hypothetical protein
MTWIVLGTIVLFYLLMWVRIGAAMREFMNRTIDAPKGE